MQDTLGLSLLGLGKFGLAIEVLQRARDTMNAKLGPDHPDTLKTLNNLGLAYWYDGKTARAIAHEGGPSRTVVVVVGSDHRLAFSVPVTLARQSGFPVVIVP